MSHLTCQCARTCHIVQPRAGARAPAAQDRARPRPGLAVRIHGSAARTAAAAGPRGGGAGGAHRWHSTSIIVQSETRRRARPAGGKRIVLVKQIGLWAAVPRDNERNAPPGCWISSQVRRTGNANGRHMPVKTRIGQAPLLVASTVALWLVPLAEPAAQLHDR